MVVAAWQGSTRPAGSTLMNRCPQPPMQAFGSLRIVVGDDVVDDEAAAQAPPRRFDHGGGLLELLAGRQQRGAVLQRPAVVLHVRDLEPAGAEPDGEVDHLGDARRVVAVDDGVQRSAPVPLRARQAAASSLRPCAPARPPMRSPTDGVDVLKADLHVFQAGRGERGDALPIEQDAGGDQVGVEAAPGGVLDQARRDPVAPSVRRRRSGPAARRDRRPRRTPGTRSRCRARGWPAPAPAGWSSRRSASGSDA